MSSWEQHRRPAAKRAKAAAVLRPGTKGHAVTETERERDGGVGGHGLSGGRPGLAPVGGDILSA